MITLRNFTNADIGQLQKYEYCTLSQTEAEKLVATWNEKSYQGRYFEMFAIVENGEIVGNASLYERSEHIVSCGLKVYPEFRGKGYATQAYRLLLSLAKQHGYTVAVAQVLAENAASIALNKKLGFEAEEYNYLNKKGEPVYYLINAL